MRNIFLASLVMFVLGCSDRNAADQPAPRTEVTAENKVKKPGFVFDAPDGFQWDDELGLWYNDDGSVGISLHHTPGESFEAVSGDFTEERMRRSNLELISKETRDIEGRPTLLLQGNKLNATVPKKFCTVVYATDVGVAQLTAIYEADTADELRAAVEHALITSRHNTPK